MRALGFTVRVLSFSTYDIASERCSDIAGAREGETPLFGMISRYELPASGWRRHGTSYPPFDNLH